MMASSKELAENVDKIIEAEEKKANYMHAIEFNRQSTFFLSGRILKSKTSTSSRKICCKHY